MKRAAVIILLLVCFPFLAQAETLVEQDGRITGTIAVGKYAIDVDMPVPASFPGSVPQNKLRITRYDKNTALQAVRVFGLEPKKGERWVMDVTGNHVSGNSLFYREEYGKQGWIVSTYSGVGIPMDDGNAQQLQAVEKARAFLDALGYMYEYPFYVCTEDFRSNVLQESPLHPWRSLEEYNRANAINGNPVAEAVNTLIVARSVLDGVPFGTDITWTKGTDRSGDGNPTPHAVLKITPEGKVASAIICFDYVVEKSAPDGRPILDWREILMKNAAYIVQIYGTDSSESGVKYPQGLTLIGVDPLLYVNDQSVTFPVWSFVIQRDSGYLRDAYPGLPEPGYFDVVRLTYDARTGEKVW